MDDFLHSLKKQQNDSLAKLVSAYAEQDAAAAFRLAELSNLNLAEAFPEIVIKYCDQAPFFDMVIDNALRDRQDRINSWAPLIATAGLYSQLVSHKLQERSPAAEWIAALSAIPSLKQWDEKGLFRPNFLTQCLALAVHQEKPSADPLLTHFREIPSPRRFGYRRKVVTGIVIVLICFLVFVTQPPMLSYQVHRPDEISRIFLAFISPILALEVVVCGYWFYVSSAHRVYREVLYGNDKTIIKVFSIFTLNEMRLRFLDFGLLKITPTGRILVQKARMLTEYRASIRPSK